jgi:uncharacterized protein YbjT (DUF2867 family)
MTVPLEPLVLAVVGVTGTVGRTVLEVLDELDVAVKALRPFASPRSAGTTVAFRDDDLKVEALREGAFRGCDVAIFCAGPAVARPLRRIPERCHTWRNRCSRPGAKAYSVSLDGETVTEGPLDVTLLPPR